MNSKTAKLINRYAAVNKMSRKMLKKVWNRMPRNKRHEHRKGLKEVLTAADLSIAS